MIRGIAVHTAIENFYKHKLNRCRDMVYSDLRQIVMDLFRSEWDDSRSDLVELKLNPDELDFYYTQSEKMMINFLGDFICSHGFDKPDPIVEKTLFSHKYKLLARLDKIERNRSPPVITDFKTSKSKEITEDTKRQMGLCSLLYEEIFKIKPDLIVHFLNFRSGKLAVPISDDYKKYLKEQIANIRHKTQSKDINDYPCKCGWCDKNFMPAKT